MSELLSNRKKFTLAQVARRYAEYLSASCGGLRVELWALRAEGWKCVATEDGSGGLFGDKVSKTAEPRTSLIDGKVLVTTISSRSKRILGALVVAGPGAELVEFGYAGAIADMTRGLMETLSGADAPAAEAA